MPVELLRKVKAAGFDFIRLSVDPGPLLALTGTERDDLESHCLDVVRQIRQVGLDVVFDFHPISMVKPFGRTRIMASEGDKLFDAYVDMVRRFAQKLGPLDPGHVALEPMNEPAIGNDPAATARWQKMMDRLYDAARAESARHAGHRHRRQRRKPRRPVRTRSETLRSPYPVFVPLLSAVCADPCRRQFHARRADVFLRPAVSGGGGRLRAVLEAAGRRLEANKALKPDDRAEILSKGRKRIENYFNREGNRAFIAGNFQKAGDWAQERHCPGPDLPGRVRRDPAMPAQRPGHAAGGPRPLARRRSPGSRATRLSLGHVGFPACRPPAWCWSIRPIPTTSIRALHRPSGKRRGNRKRPKEPRITRMTRTSTSDPFTIARQHHQAGRLEAAVKTCMEIIATEPRHADALHLLGVIACQVDRYENGAEYIRQAIAVAAAARPPSTTAWACPWRGLARWNEAIASHHRALELKPDYAEAHYNLGNVFRGEQRLDEAAAAYRRAVELRPDFADAHNNLGTVLKTQGKLDDAIAACRRAAELLPESAMVLCNLGSVLTDQGKTVEAAPLSNRPPS